MKIHAQIELTWHPLSDTVLTECHIEVDSKFATDDNSKVTCKKCKKQIELLEKQWQELKGLSGGYIINPKFKKDPNYDRIINERLKKSGECVKNE